MKILVTGIVFIIVTSVIAFAFYNRIESQDIVNGESVKPTGMQDNATSPDILVDTASELKEVATQYLDMDARESPRTITAKNNSVQEYQPPYRTIHLNISLSETDLDDPLLLVPSDLADLDVISLEVSFDVGGAQGTSTIKINDDYQGELVELITSAVNNYAERLNKRMNSVEILVAENYRLTALTVKN